MYHQIQEGLITEHLFHQLILLFLLEHETHFPCPWSVCGLPSWVVQFWMRPSCVGYSTRRSRSSLPYYPSNWRSVAIANSPQTPPSSSRHLTLRRGWALPPIKAAIDYFGWVPILLYVKCSLFFWLMCVLIWLRFLKDDFTPEGVEDKENDGALQHKSSINLLHWEQEPILCMCLDRVSVLLVVIHSWPRSEMHRADRNSFLNFVSIGNWIFRCCVAGRLTMEVQHHCFMSLNHVDFKRTVRREGLLMLTWSAGGNRTLAVRVGRLAHYH